MAQHQTIRTVRHFRTPEGDNTWIEREAIPHASVLHIARHLVDIITGALVLLVALRFVLQLFGTVAGSDFAQFIYATTQPLVTPFAGILPDGSLGAMKLESASVISLIAITFNGSEIQQLLYAFEPDHLDDEIV